jgi:putative exporter of polyketide antibiotics
MSIIKKDIIKLATVIILSVIVFFVSCNRLYAQAKKDSVATTTDSTITKASAQMAYYLLTYVGQNFKSITIQQYEDFQKYILSFSDQFLNNFILEHEKKKKK